MQRSKEKQCPAQVKSFYNNKPIEQQALENKYKYVKICKPDVVRNGICQGGLSNGSEGAQPTLAHP